MNNDSFHRGTGEVISVSASSQSVLKNPQSRLSGFRAYVSM
tara:strand:- start:2583 stop:2705 length:123 start_codon:yes stop_codon:yes gene_type:complete